MSTYLRSDSYFEAWTHLAGLAALTKTIRIGCLVSSNTFRHPALLAKEVATVDHISNGRLIVGIGAGYYEPEHTMFGLYLPETKELIARFEEAVRLIDQLLRNDTSSFEGRYYQTREARMRPGPVQRPRPPLLIGGKGRRMLRICARYADIWNSVGTPDELRERNQLLNEACAEVGREPASIVRSVYHWVPRSTDDPWSSADAFEDVVGRYRDAGFNEFIIDHPKDEQLKALEKVAADVLPKLRRAAVEA
jgi:alkanesulfonate monooxygenase SsuD/methylene tetrahydromethanopterin reductase-like flavin-dependent oxidoreductase (luciferase family)